MPAVAHVFETMHLVLLVGFVSVTGLLMLVTLVNRLRVRSPLMTWRRSRLRGWPVWPTLFMVAVLGFMGFSRYSGFSISPYVFAGYLVGGAFWFTAVWVATSLIVTEYGVLSSVNRTGHAIAWGQVVDYFPINRQGRQGVVLFFQAPRGTRQRFEITIPSRHYDGFMRLLRTKVDARFDRAAQRAYGRQAMEE